VGIVGLLHDFDYERWPDPPRHPLEGARILGELNYPPEVIYAIKSHAIIWPDCPRLSPLDKALYACDELAGFVTAVARLRPEGIHGLPVTSVKRSSNKRASRPRSAATKHRPRSGRFGSRSRRAHSDGHRRHDHDRRPARAGRRSRAGGTSEQGSSGPFGLVFSSAQLISCSFALIAKRSKPPGDDEKWRQIDGVGNGYQRHERERQIAAGHMVAAQDRAEQFAPKPQPEHVAILQGPIWATSQ